MGQFLIIENFIANYDKVQSEDRKTFELENRRLWDENGNKLSSQYTGTASITSTDSLKEQN